MAKVANIRVTGSQLGAPVVKPTNGPSGKWGLMAVALAVGFVPIVGPGVMHLVERFRHSEQAKDSKKDLAHWYRKQIAVQLGVPENKVSESDLELAARTNPTFKSMLDRVDKDEKLSNRASLIGAVVATPFSIAGAGTIAAKATEIGVGMAAGTAATMLGKDYLLVDDVANHINQKRLAGHSINAEDVFYLRLAHDKPLQDVLRKQNGAAFHKMTTEQQEAVIRSMPDAYYDYAAGLAQRVNSGRMTEQELVVAAGQNESTRMARQNSWVSKVGGSRAMQGSFVAREQGRAAQMQGPPQFA